MPGFLDGVTVLDLASVGPAARASRWLADYGARVVKVGAPAGVQIEPPFYAYSAHRGMERMTVDLKSDSGRDEFLTAAASADVIIESFRPGVVDRLGIGYDSVKGRNPGIVYCSTTGFGQDGPRSQWAGHDLNYLAVGGYLDCSGRDAGGRPPLPGATVADSAAGGMHAVMSILAALVARSSTGEGAYLDVSVADGVLALMALAVDEFLAAGVVPGPGHGMLTGRYACYDVYGCRDEKWLTVAAIEPRFWANLCRALGLEQWVDHQTDDAVQDRIRRDLAAAFRTRTRDEWVADLGPADACVAPVLSVPEVVGDEQFDARGAFVDATDPEHGPFRQVGYTLAGTRAP
jgi:alpha-methylacyl-CoA racemase